MHNGNAASWYYQAGTSGSYESAEDESMRQAKEMQEAAMAQMLAAASASDERDPVGPGHFNDPRSPPPPHNYLPYQTSSHQYVPHPTPPHSTYEYASRRPSETYGSFPTGLPAASLDSPTSSENPYSPSFNYSLASPASLDLSRTASVESGFGPSQLDWQHPSRNSEPGRATGRSAEEDWRMATHPPQGASWDASGSGAPPVSLAWTATSTAAADFPSTLLQPTPPRYPPSEYPLPSQFDSRPPFQPFHSTQPQPQRPRPPTHRQSRDAVPQAQWSSVLPPESETDTISFETIFPFDHSLFSATNVRHLPQPNPPPPRNLAPLPIHSSSLPFPTPSPQAHSMDVDPSTPSPKSSSTPPRPVTAEPRAAAKRPKSQPTPKRASSTASASDSKPGTASRSPNQPETESAPRKAVKKVTREEDCSCSTCGTLIARLILRATKDDFLEPYAHVYACFVCEPRAAGSPGEDVKPSEKDKGKATTFRKRTKRADGTNLVACDVCLKDIASGAVLTVATDVEVGFAVEVVCASCTQKYRRCSDCGGGGGARLGVGKWRAKELFSETRKTCKLTHTRLGLLSDMCYDVWAVSEIPTDEKDYVSDQCGAMFRNTMLSGMAIPEVMENQQSAMAQTFPEMDAMAQNGWRALQQLIRVDVEESRAIRRYVALRTCIPNPRKGQRAKAAKESTPTDPPEPVRTVIQNGKELAGVILCEYDLVNGTLFFALVMPWATGETYDATTILIQELLRRVEDDRAMLNDARLLANLPPYPEVLHVWTMMFFKRDSRMLYHLINRRGFCPLDEYVLKYPDTNRAAFAPIRPVYLPVERQEGWHILVRRQTPGYGGDLEWKPKQSAEQMQGKRKELRGQARRVERGELE